MGESEPRAKPIDISKEEFVVTEDKTSSNESQEDDDLSRWESEGGSMARQVPDEITEGMQGG